MWQWVQVTVKREGEVGGEFILEVAVGWRWMVGWLVGCFFCKSENGKEERKEGKCHPFICFGSAVRSEKGRKGGKRESDSERGEIAKRSKASFLITLSGQNKLCLHMRDTHQRCLCHFRRSMPPEGRGCRSSLRTMGHGASRLCCREGGAAFMQHRH